MNFTAPILLTAALHAALALPSAAQAQQSEVQLHEQRAQQYLHENKPALAVPELQAVVAAQPGNLDAQANLGVLLFFAGNYKDSEPHLSAAVQQAPNLTKLQALLGMCQHRLGDAKEALANLQAAFPVLTDTKTRRQAGLELVELYTASNELEKAVPVIDTLKQAEPTDPEVLYAAWRVYTDLAGESLLDLSVAAPGSAQMHQAIAHELVRERDLPAAIDNYRKAIAINPHLPGIHYELAEALHASEDLSVRAQAEAEYRLALRENPSDAGSHVRLGDLAADRGDIPAAAAEYKQALQLQPGNADASVGLARTLTAQGQPAAALPLLQNVITADPSNLQAHYRLSTVYRQLKRPADAKHALDEYERYKTIRDQLAGIYKQMRSDPSGSEKSATGMQSGAAPAAPPR